MMGINRKKEKRGGKEIGKVKKEMFLFWILIIYWKVVFYLKIE